MLGMVLGGVGAVLILVAAVTKMWFSMDERGREISIGLRSIEQCETDDGQKECETEKIPARGKLETFAIFGNVTFFLSFAAMISLLAAVAMHAMRKSPPLAGMIGLAVSVGIYLLCAIIFVSSIPEGGRGGPSVSLGFFMALAGAGAGIASVVLAKNAGAPPMAGAAPYGYPPQAGYPQQPPQGYGQPPQGYGQPAQPGYGQPPAAPAQQAAAGQACPRCHAPATWVAQYNRWFCDRCQQYV